LFYNIHNLRKNIEIDNSDYHNHNIIIFMILKHKFLSFSFLLKNISEGNKIYFLLTFQKKITNSNLMMVTKCWSIVMYFFSFWYIDNSVYLLFLAVTFVWHYWLWLSSLFSSINGFQKCFLAYFFFVSYWIIKKIST